MQKFTDFGWHKHTIIALNVILMKIPAKSNSIMNKAEPIWVAISKSAIYKNRTQKRPDSNDCNQIFRKTLYVLVYCGIHVYIRCIPAIHLQSIANFKKFGSSLWHRCVFVCVFFFFKEHIWYWPYIYIWNTIIFFSIGTVFVLTRPYGSSRTQAKYTLRLLF